MRHENRHEGLPYFQRSKVSVAGGSVLGLDAVRSVMLQWEEDY